MPSLEHTPENPIKACRFVCNTHAVPDPAWQYFETGTTILPAPFTQDLEYSRRIVKVD